MSKYPVICRKLFSCYMSFKGIRMAELWWYQMTISLVTKNQGKSRQPLPQISSNLHATVQQVPHPPIWKWKPPYSGTFSFSNYSSTPRSGLKKWHKNIVSITTVVLQDYSQGYIFIYFPHLSLSRNFIECSLKAYAPWWQERIFKFLVLRLLENAYVSQKADSKHFLLMSSSKLSLRVLSSLNWREITHSPETAFVEILEGE